MERQIERKGKRETLNYVLLQKLEIHKPIKQKRKYTFTDFTL